MAKPGSSEKIDMFPHILTRKYKEALFKKAKPSFYLKADKIRPALWDLDIRFRSMDKFEGLRQTLTLAAPPLEDAFSPEDAVELAQMANDEMAELVNKHPDRFVAAAACLPLNDVDAAIRETERAIKDLNFKGIQISSSINRKPLDRPEFMGLYEMMAQFDLPIWIHPVGDEDIPDYPDEESSKYNLNLSFGWPYQTTLAMSRLVYSGIMEKFPNLKFITHHCGAMLPFFSDRVQLTGLYAETTELTKPPLEYFKRFYGDTCLGRNVPALMCGYDFFGADHMLLGTDYPFPGGPEFCDVALGGAIKAVEGMDVTEKEKTKIFSENAKRILRLS